MNKLMIFAAGALTALAFAALPTAVSAEEMQAHCSTFPCEGFVEGTGNAVLTEDNGLTITCTTISGGITQTAATSTTVTATLTFSGCSLSCQNEGAGTGKILTNKMIGHLITVTKGDPNTAGILLTNIHIHFTCVALGIPSTKTVTGNLIGTIPNPECGVAKAHHTLSFTQTSAGQQTDKTYTGGTFDLLSNGTTASLTGEAHINWHVPRTVTITC